MNKIYLVLIISLVIQGLAAQQPEKADLPVKLEELTSPQFKEAVNVSGKIAIIPIGVIETHGPHLPLMSDILTAREISLRAAAEEYAIVFPSYYFGQVHEGRHAPGNIAYSHELIWNLLQETCEELSRNGIKKIIIVNGHGGNTHWLSYFVQSQLASQKDYAVILFRPGFDRDTRMEIDKLKKTDVDTHAGERETSAVYYLRPDLVNPEIADKWSGEDKGRLTEMPYGFTGIWWYGRFPNHYGGDGSQPNAELGELLITAESDQLVQLIRYLKQNDTVLELQEEFFKQARDPVNEFKVK